jgi:hypothetical protein
MLINKWRKEYVRYFYRHLYEKYKWPQDVIMRRAGINAMVKGSDGEIVKLLEIYGIPTPCNQKKQSLESVTYGIQMNRLVGAQEKPGWIWYSKADYMIYCIPITGGMIFHRMKLADLRDWLADGRKHRRYPVENLKYGGEIRRIRMADVQSAIDVEVYRMKKNEKVELLRSGRSCGPESADH